MKKVVLIFMSLLCLSSLVFGASLNLKAVWDANTEPDMKEYRLYRIDIPRTLIGTIPHPQTEYRFVIEVADNSEGVLRFVLTAVDTSNNESADSNEATYPFDFKAPVAPAGVRIERQ